VSTAAQSEIPTVREIDLNRYQGLWYEISAIPASFQAKCASDTTAEYKLLNDGRIQVLNSCAQKNDDRSLAEGRARLNPKFNSPGKLQVTFVKFFTWIWAFSGDYWIIDLDPDYRYVVIGHPKLTYGWILARTRTLPMDTLLILRSRLTNIGYDPCRFIMSQNAEKAFEPGTRLCDL
jgi:apolipoprotein D and lipocalin family protein